MSDNLITLTDANFASEVDSSTGPMIVDFWAQWCGPCRMLTPIREQLATEQEGKVKIGKVNIDENPELTSRFKVQSIPLLVFFKDGKEVESVAGVQSKDALNKRLAALA